MSGSSARLTVHVCLEQLEEHVVCCQSVQDTAQKLPTYAVHRARQTVAGLGLPRVPLARGQTETPDTTVNTQTVAAGLRLPRVPLAGGQTATAPDTTVNTQTVAGLRLPRVPLTRGQTATPDTSVNRQTVAGLGLPRVPLTGGQTATPDTTVNTQTVLLGSNWENVPTVCNLGIVAQLYSTNRAVQVRSDATASTGLL